MAQESLKTDKHYSDYLNIFESMKSDFEIRRPDYIDIRDLLSPASGKFYENDDFSDAVINYKKLLDAEPAYYLSLTSNGLYGGIINPAEEWVDLVPSSPELQRNTRVMAYFAEQSRRLRYLLDHTNFYDAAKIVFQEAPAFGFGAMITEERDEDFIFFRPFTIGEYYLGTDADGNYDKIGFSLFLGADDMVKLFGYDNCPKMVTDAYDKGIVKNLFQVNTLIAPNFYKDKGGTLTKRMPYVNLSWIGESMYDGQSVIAVPQNQSSASPQQWLQKAGFNSNPLSVFPWAKRSYTDAYAMGIGHMILGDARELQETVLRGSMNEAFATNPSLALHASIGKKPILPGSRHYTDNDPAKVAAPMMQVDLHIDAIENKKKTLKERLSKMTYSELFLAIGNNPSSRRTAEEIAALKNEQMKLLAPFYMSSMQFLKSTIARVVEICYRREFFEMPPPELQGIQFEAVFQSGIAKAQRIAEVTSIESTVRYIGALAQIDPSVIDYVDSDKIAGKVAALFGTSDILRDQEDVEQIRQGRAEQQAQMAELEKQAQEAKIAKDYAKANVSRDNALGMGMEAMGVSLPQEQDNVI